MAAFTKIQDAQPLGEYKTTSIDANKWKRKNTFIGRIIQGPGLLNFVPRSSKKQHHIIRSFSHNPA